MTLPKTIAVNHRFILNIDSYPDPKPRF